MAGMSKCNYQNPPRGRTVDQVVAQIGNLRYTGFRQTLPRALARSSCRCFLRRSGQVFRTLISFAVSFSFCAPLLAVEPPALANAASHISKTPLDEIRSAPATKAPERAKAARVGV